MSAEQRIYKVISSHKEHLVQASSQSQALRHIAGKYYTVEVAKAIEVAQMMGKGVEIEVATVVADQTTLPLEETK